MKLRSPAFSHGQPIPKPYTCRGANINPPLQWSEVPVGTKSFVLIVRDQDAQPVPWIHWLVYNIPAAATSFPEDGMPSGAVGGICNGGTVGYEGPCPKYFAGTHHYRFTLYALDIALSFPETADTSMVLEAQEGQVLAVAELLGTAEGELEEKG